MPDDSTPTPPPVPPQYRKEAPVPHAAPPIAPPSVLGIKLRAPGAASKTDGLGATASKPPVPATPFRPIPPTPPVRPPIPRVEPLLPTKTVTVNPAAPQPPKPVYPVIPVMPGAAGSGTSSRPKKSKMFYAGTDFVGRHYVIIKDGCLWASHRGFPAESEIFRLKTDPVVIDRHHAFVLEIYDEAVDIKPDDFPCDAPTTTEWFTAMDGYSRRSRFRLSDKPKAKEKSPALAGQIKGHGELINVVCIKTGYIMCVFAHVQKGDDVNVDGELRFDETLSISLNDATKAGIMAFRDLINDEIQSVVFCGTDFSQEDIDWCEKGMLFQALSQEDQASVQTTLEELLPEINAMVPEACFRLARVSEALGLLKKLDYVNAERHCDAFGLSYAFLLAGHIASLRQRESGNNATATIALMAGQVQSDDDSKGEE